MSDAWATARELIERHGAEATLVAECRAIEELMGGDAAASAAWERVITALDALIEEPAGARRPAALLLH
jgi:hypothetical protein